MLLFESMIFRRFSMIFRRFEATVFLETSRGEIPEGVQKQKDSLCRM